MSESDKAFVFHCLSNVMAEGNIDECGDQQILLIVNLSMYNFFGKYLNTLNQIP
jgi:hypothetical protein